MIWLAGCRGMLGTEVRRLLEARGLPHVATDLDTDIAQADSVLGFAREASPTWILNCAGYTAVDRAEGEPERAHQVNALGALHLAQAAKSVGARLVHVSTDYVFDGGREGPYAEDAPVAPLGAYGRTKAAGEAFVRETCPRHVTVRTAWLHGPHGGNFVATMLRLMAERPELQVVDDQRGSPTYAPDLAGALLAFVAHEDDDLQGTYHYVNHGACTWHDYACEIQARALDFGLLSSPVPIRPIPTSAYPTPAQRPANSVLGTDRIRRALGLRIPSWQDGLARHLHRLKEGDRRP